MSEPCASHTVCPPLPRHSSDTSTQLASPLPAVRHVPPAAHASVATHMPAVHCSRSPAVCVEQRTPPSGSHVSSSGAGSGGGSPGPPLLGPPLLGSLLLGPASLSAAP